ncbi:hypothetical protein M885DRAFT_560605 [Pelagophyceae sp. CCMP2097]|nr:hypothetical protein M885DRAFT_560605 [Pelagophyceae sp. CCMP2097]
MQALLLRSHRLSGFMGKVDKMAASIGMQRFANMNQFHWFDNLFDVEHGIFDCMHYDDLHMLFLGWIPRLVGAIKKMCQRHYKKNATLHTPEDVRALIESLLKRVPSMTDGVRRLKTFEYGWWVQESWGGSDNEAILQQMSP